MMCFIVYRPQGRLLRRRHYHTLTVPSPLSALLSVGYNDDVMQEVQEQAEHASENVSDPNKAHHEARERIIVGVGAVLTLVVVGLVLWLMVGR
jgi:hypothetical protein